MSDDFLIEKVLYHLDWEYIMKLFEIYPKKQIKNVWKNNLCPLGKYFGRMNILFAVVLFDIKNPERYISNQRNKHIKNKLSENERFISELKTSI